MSENLSPNAEENQEISLLDLLQTVVDNLRFLVVGSVGAGFLALIVSLFITPAYTAKLVIMPPQLQQSNASAMLQSLGAIGGLAGAAAGIKNPSDQYVAMLKGRSIQDAIIDKFNLLEQYGVKYKQDARKLMEELIKISTGKDGLIIVEVDDKDPKMAADIANAHGTELSNLMSRMAFTEAQQRRQFFELQLSNAKDNMVKAELALKATGVSADILKGDPASAGIPVAQLRAQIDAQEVRIGSMRGYLADSAPELKQALMELSVLRAQLEKQNQSSAVGKDANGYIERFRTFKYYETLYEIMAKQYESARLDEIREAAPVQVVDSAVPPERKSKPKKALITVFSTAAAGLLLLLYIFVKQALSNAVKDDQTAVKIANIKSSWQRAIQRERWVVRIKNR